MGDANADWLAFGLEDAFSEKPEIGIVRKHRTDSGLIRYDQRRDSEWPQVAREIITAEKPKFVVMMIGNNDRQTIREKAPPPWRAEANAPPDTAAPGSPTVATGSGAAARRRQQHPHMTLAQARQADYGPWEFQSEKWELAYIKRIDAIIAALKSAGVPVIWVGLASQRGTKASEELAYLNELYRSEAVKAGIVYVDVWDGFVDEAGRFSAQGPDYVGQIRRLRTGDGVYFTKFGARKLAHYVEREIERSLSSQRAFRWLCRFRSILPRRHPKPSRVFPPSGRKLDRSCRSRPRALPRKNCSAAAAPLPLPHRRNRHSHPHEGRAGRARRAVEPTISAGRVARSMSPARSSLRRLALRGRMPARSAMDAYAQTIQEQKATQRRPRMHR